MPMITIASSRIGESPMNGTSASATIAPMDTCTAAIVVASSVRSRIKRRMATIPRP